MKFHFAYDSRGFDEAKPLIYVWYVGTHVYVGKSESGAKRPLKHYRRNVDRYFAGKPYRASNPHGWRKVHLAMVDATERNQRIRLEILANVDSHEVKFHFAYDSRGFDEAKPLIYVWYVGTHVYVGKSESGAKRPLKHYRRNEFSFGFNTLIIERPRMTPNV